MLVPRNTVSVEKAERGFVATTSLIDGPSGSGNSEKEAIANLDWAVRAYLKSARNRGQEIPEAFRVSTTTKAVAIGAALLLVLIVRIIVYYATQ